MKANIALVLALVAVVIASYGLFGAKDISLGGTTNFDALTLTTGPLIVTTSNTATSTIQVGCVQTTATSTATPVKQVFVTTGATSTFNGTVYWQYGTCP